MPSWALENAKRIEKGETGPDHSLDIADITAPAVVTCTEATPDNNKGTETAVIEAAQRCSHSAHSGHSHRTHSDAPHQPHCSSSTHHSSSGYHSQDHSRSHSCPSYKSSKYTSHQKGSCTLWSYSYQETQKPHPKRNRNAQIEEPPSNYYSSHDNSTNSGEESESLN